MSFIEKHRVYLRLKLIRFTDFVSYLFEQILFTEKHNLPFDTYFPFMKLEKVFYMIVIFTQFIYNAGI